jgi:hypothetical protein
MDNRNQELKHNFKIGQKVHYKIHEDKDVSAIITRLNSETATVRISTHRLQRIEYMFLMPASGITQKQL